MKDIGLLFLAIITATMYTVVYGQQQDICSIPADKKEITGRLINGTLNPSYTPTLFFGHFSNGKNSANIHAAVSTAHGR
jgi:hypothetical protein